MLKDNYDKVAEKISHACERSGRDVKDVTLIAVSSIAYVILSKRAKKKEADENDETGVKAPFKEEK